MAEIDHEYTDAPVCPHCGHKHTEDLWEYGDGALYKEDESVEIECESCSGDFRATCVFVSYTYSTSTFDKEAEEAERKREIEEQKRWQEERRQACAAFTPGTRVRMARGTWAEGRVGTVENRELSDMVPVRLDATDKLGEYSTHVFPKDLNTV